MPRTAHYLVLRFWATVCNTVNPILSEFCSVCPVCNVDILWPNSWMHQDQDETCHACRLRPWPHFLRWDLAPLPKKAQPPILSPHLFWPNGWMDQDATWYGGRPRTKQHYVTRRPTSSLPRTGGRASPNFWAMSIVAKRLDGSRCHLVWRYTSAQASLC